MNSTTEAPHGGTGTAAIIMRVLVSLIRPVQATEGQYLAWFPADGLVVMARQGSGWRVVRTLPHDSPSADNTVAILLDKLERTGTIARVYEGDTSPASVARPRLTLLPT